VHCSLGDLVDFHPDSGREVAAWWEKYVLSTGKEKLMKYFHGR
jgi:hypothetical protein